MLDFCRGLRAISIALMRVRGWTSPEYILLTECTNDSTVPCGINHSRSQYATGMKEVKHGNEQCEKRAWAQVSTWTAWPGKDDRLNAVCCRTLTTMSMSTSSCTGIGTSRALFEAIPWVSACRMEETLTVVSSDGNDLRWI